MKNKVQDIEPKYEYDDPDFDPTSLSANEMKELTAKYEGILSKADKVGRIGLGVVSGLAILTAGVAALPFIGPAVGMAGVGSFLLGEVGSYMVLGLGVATLTSFVGGLAAIPDDTGVYEERIQKMKIEEKGRMEERFSSKNDISMDVLLDPTTFISSTPGIKNLFNQSSPRQEVVGLKPGSDLAGQDQPQQTRRTMFGTKI